MSDFKVGDILSNTQGSDYTIIEYKNSRNVIVEFNDAHKHQAKIRAYALKTGMIRNPFHPSVSGVGYIGVGEFSSSANNIGKVAYTKWQSMLERCYEKDSKDLKYPAYSDCSVHTDWHNFQNFAKWFVSQKHHDAGYDIDKDILITGNRVYSEDTCCLVPPEINNMAVSLRFIGVRKPMGISYNKKSRKYIAKICMGGYQKYIGSYKTLEQASAAYIELKKRYFKNMAIVHKDRLDRKVIEALWYWEELKEAS